MWRRVTRTDRHLSRRRGRFVKWRHGFFLGDHASYSSLPPRGAWLIFANAQTQTVTHTPKARSVPNRIEPVPFSCLSCMRCRDVSEQMRMETHGDQPHRQTFNPGAERADSEGTASQSEQKEVAVSRVVTHQCTATSCQVILDNRDQPGCFTRCSLRRRLECLLLGSGRGSAVRAEPPLPPSLKPASNWNSSLSKPTMPAELLAF